MKTKVTIQDIADELNLSRITVSKVLNHSPNVSDETRDLVLKKAQERIINPVTRPTPMQKNPARNPKALLL